MKEMQAAVGWEAKASTVRPTRRGRAERFGWASWLKRHGVLILCLQETKMDRDYLSKNPKEQFEIVR